MIKYLHTFFPVDVAVCFSQKTYNKELKRLGVSEETCYFIVKNAACARYRLKNGRLTIFICFDPIQSKKLHKNQIIGLLVHEVCHACDWIFEEIGEENVGLETRAYLNQYFLQETMDFLDYFSKKVKKP